MALCAMRYQSSEVFLCSQASKALFSAWQMLLKSDQINAAVQIHVTDPPLPRAKFLRVNVFLSLL